MKKLYKIVLLSFGYPGEKDKNINGALLSEVLVGESNFRPCELYKIPKTRERFMVVGEACEDKIFKCLRVDDHRNKNVGYDYVIIASFVNRVSFEKNEDELARLKEFTQE